MIDSQAKQIRKALESGATLSAIDALNKFGCFRLAARIHDLKAEGMDIQVAKEESNGKSFAIYYLAL